MSITIRVDEQHERLDFTLAVLYAIDRGCDPRATLRDIADTLDRTHPGLDLHRVGDAALEDARLHVEALTTRLRANANETIERIVFDHDRYYKPAFGFWAGPSSVKPVRTDPLGIGITSFAPIQELMRPIEDVGQWSAAVAFLQATSLFLTRDLVDASALALPRPDELDVFFGSIRVGRCDRDGFVPSPLALVREQLDEQRDATTAGLIARDFPGLPPIVRDYPLPPNADALTRRLRHVDGRSWEIAIKGPKLVATLTEANGENETLKRSLKTGWSSPRSSLPSCVPASLTSRLSLSSLLRDDDAVPSMEWRVRDRRRGSGAPLECRAMLLEIRTACLIALVGAAACGDDGKPPQDSGPHDALLGDGGVGGDAADANSSQCTTANECPCFSNDDCPAGTRCHAADETHVYCEPGARGTGAAGAPCTGEMDCESALCVDGTDQMRCSKTCTTMTDCPAELPRCVDIFEASICARQP